MKTVGRIRRQIASVVLVAFALTACGAQNEGFDVPPFEDIEAIAFVKYPGSTLRSESVGSEDSSMTIDGAPLCEVTNSRRVYVLAEPVAFSVLQAFYNRLAGETGWEVVNTRSEASAELFHPRYAGTKEVNGRTHLFNIWALASDGLATVDLDEDQLVTGFEVSYRINPDPEHPFC